MRLAISTIICMVMTVASQAQLLSFKNYGLDKGAFPSRIECISQTSKGELCIGTLAGMVLYDGDQFQTLTEADGLAENAISSLTRVGDTIWIGHWAGNITAFDAKSKATKVLPIGEELKYSAVTDIYKDARGLLWVINRNGEVFRISNRETTQIPIPKPLNEEKAIDIFQRGDELFLLTNKRLFRLKLINNVLDWDERYRTSSDLVAVQSLNATEWAIAMRNRVVLYDEQSSREVAIVEGEQSSITSLLQDMEEYLWIGTSSNGLIKYHTVSGAVDRITRDNGLSYDEVRSLYKDREGQVWVATGAGLDQYLGGAFVLTDARAGIPHNLIWDFYELPSSTLLASSGGLFEAAISDGVVESYNSIEIGDEEPRKILVNGNKVYVITAQGNVWFGNTSAGFKRIEVNEFATSAGRAGDEVWIGTTDGVVKLKNNLPYEQFTVESGLGGNYVNGIYYCSKTNETWITSLGAPVTKFSKGGFNKYGDNQGMTSKVIQDVDFDANGNPWFATYDKGVFYVQNDSVYSISKTSKLSTESAFAIDIDSAQVVWIGHNAGIDAYDIESREVDHFGVERGFIGVEVNPGAMKFGRNGSIITGTLMGLLQFDPSLIRTNISEPIVHVNRLSIAGKSLLDEEDAEVKANLDLSNLLVSYSAISLTDPTQNYVEYRLVGMHDYWRRQNGQKEIEYLSIPPGDFIFELRACNSDGTCIDQPLTFGFSVLPPFYQTWWFYTFCFVLIIVFLFLMDRFRLLAMVDERNGTQ